MADKYQAGGELLADSEEFLTAKMAPSVER